MPYWQRQAWLDASLGRYKFLYPDENIEIIVVDDGSPTPAIIQEGRTPFPWPVKLIRLPEKDHALNPCVPINEGVKVAEGQFIILTNPEVMHSLPIIRSMLAGLQILGKTGYIAAACWSTEKNKWFCHSSTVGDPGQGRAPMPPGSGFHFCSMITKQFFDKVEGFSEEYREGQAFEDNDFLWKLWCAAARFEIADDLVVNHYHTPVDWPSGGHTRNKRIFQDKWRATYLPIKQTEGDKIC